VGLLTRSLTCGTIVQTRVQREGRPNIVQDCGLYKWSSKKQIINRCKGLPLAIVVLGGFLSTRSASYQEWSKVLATQVGSLWEMKSTLDVREQRKKKKSNGQSWPKGKRYWLTPNQRTSRSSFTRI